MSPFNFDFGSVPAPMWLLLLFYALAACVWTVWLWMTGLKVVPAAQGGVFHRSAAHQRGPGGRSGAGRVPR
jgi:hypothetical protein